MLICLETFKKVGYLLKLQRWYVHYSKNLKNPFFFSVVEYIYYTTKILGIQKEFLSIKWINDEKYSFSHEFPTSLQKRLFDLEDYIINVRILENQKSSVQNRHVFILWNLQIRWRCPLLYFYRRINNIRYYYYSYRWFFQHDFWDSQQISNQFEREHSNLKRPTRLQCYNEEW